MLYTEQPRFLTLGQAAELFGVQPHTVGRWVQTGAISKAPLPGRTVRIPLSEVQRVARGDATLTRFPVKRVFKQYSGEHWIEDAEADQRLRLGRRRWERLAAEADTALAELSS